MKEALRNLTTSSQEREISIQKTLNEMKGEHTLLIREIGNTYLYIQNQFFNKRAEHIFFVYFDFIFRTIEEINQTTRRGKKNKWC